MTSQIPLIPGYIHRPEEYEQVVMALLDRSKSDVTSVTTALRGAGGFGKTTLARAVCEDARIKQAFPDGIKWVELNENTTLGNLSQKMNLLLDELGVEQPPYVDPYDASRHLKEVLADRIVLLIVDDVWNKAHLELLLQGGSNCAYLVTTRDSSVLPADAVKILVDKVKPNEGVQILRLGLPDDEEQVFEQLAERLMYWPLLLKLANGLIRKMVNDHKASLKTALAEIYEKYERQGMKGFDERRAEDRNQAVRKSLGVSLDMLEKAERQRFMELVVFPPFEAIPLAAVQTLWKEAGSLSLTDTKDLCLLLADYSLIDHYDMAEKTIQLHDVVRTHIEQEQNEDDIQHLHKALVDAYAFQHREGQEWWTLPNDGYIYSHLINHLVNAGKKDEAVKLLFDYTWLKTKLDEVGVVPIIQDYEIALTIPELSSIDRDLQLVRDCFRLSAPLLAMDAHQLPTQLLGRLMGFKELQLQSLVEQASDKKDFFWLKPLSPCFTPPGGWERFTLSGHSGPVHDVAITADGKRAVSTSGGDDIKGDFSLKVWDMENGSELFTLSGHHWAVNSVVLTKDGKRAVSASGDKTLKVWDLEQGKELFTLSGHSDGVTSVVLTPDEKRVISASSDRTLKVWDLEQGKELFTLSGHSRLVKLLALTPNGKQAVSASWDHTLKVWDLEKGRELLTLFGHSGPVHDVVLTTDGRRAVSASEDKTLRVWQLDNGTELFTLSGHSNGVNSVVLTPDGKRAVSASEDRTLKVWDLENGKELFTLSGHSDGVKSVVLTPYGKRAVSTSGDHTLKVWDLDKGRELFTLYGHLEGVISAVITPDGRQAVSFSWDCTLKVWNIELKKESFTLSEHFGRVTSIALTPNGKLAVSASRDKTLKVWDLDNGKELFTLSGHSDGVNSVVLAPNENRAISASSDRTLKVWDLDNGKELLTLSGHSDSVNSVILTPNGKLAISASNDQTLKIWDLEKGSELFTLKGHDGPIYAIAVTPDGKKVISGSRDGTLKVWDLETGSEFVTYPIDTDRIVLIPDGRRVVSGPIHGIPIVWDLEDGHELFKLSRFSFNIRQSLASDGKRVISPSYDHTLKVWDLETEKELLTLSGHQNDVIVTVISPDGKLAVSASIDKTLKVWDLASGNCLNVYISEAPLIEISVQSVPFRIVAGDSLGRVHFLTLQCDFDNELE